MKNLEKQTEAPTRESLTGARIQWRNSNLVTSDWIAPARASELYMPPLPGKFCMWKIGAHRETSYTRALFYRSCMRKIVFKSKNIVHSPSKSTILYEIFSIENNVSHTRSSNWTWVVWVGSYIDRWIRCHCMRFSRSMAIFLIQWVPKSVGMYKSGLPPAPQVQPATSNHYPAHNKRAPSPNIKQKKECPPGHSLK